MKKSQWVILSITAGLYIVFILFSPILFTSNGIFDFTSTGQIGDTLSGTMSPFIALLTAILTFLAFYIQYQANEGQKNAIHVQELQILEQKRILKIDNFERELFQYITSHRENVASLNARIYTGSENKIVTGQEFTLIVLNMINKTFTHLKNTISNMNDFNLLCAAYISMYYGDSLWDNLQIKNKHSQYLTSEVINALKILRRNMKEYQDLYKYGFGIQMSMVYRNLFNAYKYIDSYKIDSAFEDTKYNYGKKIRSNISNIEQLLLFYNIITSFGKGWVDLDLIRKFKIFKNIPMNMVFGYSPVSWIQEKYYIDDDKIVEYFEFLERI